MIARYDSTKSSYFIYSGTWYMHLVLGFCAKLYV